MQPVRGFSQLGQQPVELLGQDELPCPAVRFGSSPLHQSFLTKASDGLTDRGGFQL